MSSLYILDINPLLQIFFANIFSYSRGCLFILLMVFFAVQSFLVLCSPTGLFMFLLPLFLVSNPKYIIAKTDVKELFPYRFSRSYMVSGLTFKSLIHFESIFVYSVR